MKNYCLMYKISPEVNAKDSHNSNKVTIIPAVIFLPNSLPNLSLVCILKQRITYTYLIKKYCLIFFSSLYTVFVYTIITAKLFPIYSLIPPSPHLGTANQSEMDSRVRLGQSKLQPRIVRRKRVVLRCGVWTVA